MEGFQPRRRAAPHRDAGRRIRGYAHRKQRLVRGNDGRRPADRGPLEPYRLPLDRTGAPGGHRHPGSQPRGPPAAARTRGTDARADLAQPALTAGAHIHIDCRQPLRRSPRLWPGLAGLLALLIAGCASHVPERDGPEARPPAGLERVPDAVPRIEPLRVGGPNKPYEVLGRRYVPMTADLPLAETGLASWYGRRFHGRPTSSGEIYDMYAMTAAHKTMPIPSYARVRNPVNGREVVVRINDRGPFADGRVIDLSYTAALRLDLLRGVAPVQVQRITHDEIRAGLVAASPLPPDDGAPGDAVAIGAGLWLQLGAFRDRDGAARLQRSVLGDAEVRVTQVVIFEENALYRVQAGPYATREQALQAGDRVQRRLGISPLLVERR
ncbi:MAG: septal ring lytic transglycosylase RlpA family protein [Betaproteobacteria bacterium]|nr:septal ring lytic transglycosylase RlpA family protein [Betaproteobacteria bacterium]